MQKTILLLFTLISFIACKNEADRKVKQENYSDILNTRFTGDLSYNTTAFVEKYWRAVGNTGFNESIWEVTRKLEDIGFVLEDNASPNQRLTYRIEKRSLKYPTWEPVDACLEIQGEKEPLLQFSSNRNMIAWNSYSTKKGGISAEVVYLETLKDTTKINLSNKIVFVEVHPKKIFKAAVVNRGALGIIAYDNPDYLQPKKNTTSIQFKMFPLNEDVKSWGLLLSYDAKERLKKKLKTGKTILNVEIDTKVYPSEELTVVADIKGDTYPEQRLVFSAHVQEPGANDNATGVGVALEMASVTAKLIQEGEFSPNRTISFLWGDEIVSTRRYVKEDSLRAKNIKWGISLDMVGENTALTGGSFLIEKMPDPSAIWTRGKDKHTEWGGKKMKLDQMQPHYLNDFTLKQFSTQGKRANWIVSTNPFEGGSDHVPFLRADIPSVLFWHFTDQFYHTDNDRLDKVSKETLKNVGIAALTCAYTLVNANNETAIAMIKDIKTAALSRLEDEFKQSGLAIQNGSSLVSQIEIIKAWEDWYIRAVATCSDLVEDTTLIKVKIKGAQDEISNIVTSYIEKLNTEIPVSKR